MSLTPVALDHSHATIPDVLAADRCCSDGDALRADRDLNGAAIPEMRATVPSGPALRRHVSAR
jgi:hypothetical protein